MLFISISSLLISLIILNVFYLVMFNKVDYYDTYIELLNTIDIFGIILYLLVISTIFVVLIVLIGNKLILKKSILSNIKRI